MDWIRLGRKWLMLPFAFRYVCMPGRSFRGTTTLNAAEQEIEKRLRQHVQQLAVTIGERHSAAPQALLATRQYLKAEFASCGINALVHEFPAADYTGQNLFGVLNGQKRSVFVLGAHYDTVPGCPGANDNASGVAVLLEIARLLTGCKLQHQVMFVAFDNEEHVGQPVEAQGSRFFAEHLKSHGRQVAGMWSLETLGFYSNERHSQKFPAPLDLFYPDTGNFLGFVGNSDSQSLVRESVRRFRRIRPGFPCEGIAAPPQFRDVERSDHKWFWQCGYQALMVTDTANFRYQPYHTSQDTIDQIDFQSLARITRMLAEVVAKINLD